MNKPKKTIKGYKLLRTLKTRPGEYFPLFIGKSKSVEFNKWIPAEMIPTKGFAIRPGWHAGKYPIAPHLMKKDGSMPPDRIWAQVQFPADVNWQKVADNSRTRDIRHRVPQGGYYQFKTNKLQGGAWLIGGSIKINKLLSDQQVSEILEYV